MTSPVDELKPCPCGGKIRTRTLLGTVYFTCDKCTAQTEFTEVGLHVDEQRERWNTRAESPDSVVVTTNEQGQAVTVTRQDGEGQILSTIWEAPDSEGEGLKLIWEDTRQVEFDHTMLFGLGYDFDGLENVSLEADTPIGRFVIWPDYLSPKAKWNLYGGNLGYYERGFESEDAVKAEVLRMCTPPLPVAADVEGEKDAWHRLWEFFHDEHGLTLLNSELNDIIWMVSKYSSPPPPVAAEGELTGFPLTKTQALQILNRATDKHDPHWEWSVEEFINTETDNIPSLQDVLSALGVTKGDAIKAGILGDNPDQVSWPTTQSRSTPPPVAGGELDKLKRALDNCTYSFNGREKMQVAFDSYLAALQHQDSEKNNG